MPGLPGTGTLRATVGVAEGTYHVGAGIVTAVAHPVRTAHTIYDTCQAGVNQYGRLLGPDIACGYAIIGKPIVDQLVLAATTCASTIDRFDHLTQGILSLILLGKSRGTLRPRTTAPARYGGDAARVSGQALWGLWSDYDKVVIGGREHANINGRLYTRHAVERMAPSGLGKAAGGVRGRSVSPNFIEDVLRRPDSVTPVKGPDGEARLSYVSGHVQVITEDGIVVTIITR